MSYQQDNVQWTQMPLQNATQYQQQITGFINPPQPQSQMQVGLLPQAPPQQLPQNVYDNLALQQQSLYNQPQQMQAQNYNQQPTSQHPPPFMGHAVRQSTPQWNTPPPNQYPPFQRPPPPQQRPQTNLSRSSNQSPWNNAIANSRSESPARSRSHAESQEEPSLMDYDFGDMGAAAKNFNVESTKEKESQAMYDRSDTMEHDGIQRTQIPDSDPYRKVRKKSFAIDFARITNIKFDSLKLLSDIFIISYTLHSAMD